MADNSKIIPENPTMCTASAGPGGMPYYNLEMLTPVQQFKMNGYLLQATKDNGKYLSAHPEVRAIVALLLRHLLRKRPRHVHAAVKQFFTTRSKIDLVNEVNEYITVENMQNSQYKEEEEIEEEEETTPLDLDEEVVVLEENPKDVADFILNELLDFKPTDIVAYILNEILEFKEPEISPEFVFETRESGVMVESVPSVDCRTDISTIEVTDLSILINEMEITGAELSQKSKEEITVNEERQEEAEDRQQEGEDRQQEGEDRQQEAEDRQEEAKEQQEL